MDPVPYTDVSIRPLINADYPEWLVLWRAYQVFYKANIPEDVSRVVFSRMVDPREPSFGAFALRENRIAGIVHWILHRSNWSIGDYCYLQDLYVDSGSRGRGVGRALIQHVYRQAANAQCSRVYWLTHESNTQAMRLYDRMAERSGFLQYRKLLQDDKLHSGTRDD